MPIGDLSRCSNVLRLVDHLIGEGEQRRWHVEAEGSRGLEVDNRAFRSMRFEFEPECPQGKPLPPLSHVLRRSAGIESALN